MSVDLIQNVQQQLYKLLNNTSAIHALAPKIHLGAAQDRQPPFIVIDAYKFETIICLRKKLYQINFCISAYDRDNHHHNLTKLATLIDTEIQKQQSALCSIGHLVGISALSGEFDQARDLSLNRVKLHYRALINLQLQ